MKLVKTVKCKLEVDEEQRQIILDTIAKFIQACNDALALARKNKLWNAYKLHYRCYYQLKARYDLHANYIVRAIARVCAKRKRRPKSFKGTSLDLDARLFNFIEATEPPSISLATTKGRLKIKLAIGNFQRGMLKGQKPTAATLVYKKEHKSFYINFALEKEVLIPTPSLSGSSGSSGNNPIGIVDIVGIDRGIYNLATTSNGLKFSGKQAKHIRKHYSKLRQRLQCKGTKGTKRLLIRLSGKERRWMTNINHIISRRIVDSCKAGDILVLEELKHIRQRVRIAKSQRLIHHSWAFGQLQTFIVSPVPISVNQVRYHVRYNPEDLLEHCRKHQIALTAYSPLGRGEILHDPTLKAIAEKHGKTPAQVALIWLIQKGICVIPKASSEAHLRQNMSLFDWELTRQEIQQINGLSRQ